MQNGKTKQTAEVCPEKLRDTACDCGKEKPATQSRCKSCRQKASRNRRAEDLRHKDRLRKRNQQRAIAERVPTLMTITRKGRELAAVAAYARTLPGDECEMVLKSGGMPWVSSLGTSSVVALPESRRREKEDARFKLFAPSRGLWELARAEELKRQHEAK